MKKIALALILAASSLMASNGVDLYKQCVACHGVKGEKKALDRSEAIAGWDAARTEKALQEYKAGTRNIAGMGILMTGKVAAYSEDEIKTVSEYISALK